MAFSKFQYIADYNYSSGWDKYALDYRNLLVKDTVYYLTKEIIHRLVDETLPADHGKTLSVLDVNCGTGNDFPFFLERNLKVTGTDGSQGMLNKAFEKYQKAVAENRLELYRGQIESLSEEDFGGQQFDLIFSVTGGFSYVDDHDLLQINRMLARLLKPEGRIVLAHLNRFCLPEFLHRLYRFKNPFLRFRKKIEVKIKQETHTMYLRSPAQLKKLYTPYFDKVKTKPLLVVTPPYQTGFAPGRQTLDKLRALEFRLNSFPSLAFLADQVVVTGRGKTAIPPP